MAHDGRAGFIDDRGERVSDGDDVQHTSGRTGVVLDVSITGTAVVRFSDGTVETVNWADLVGVP